MKAHVARQLVTQFFNEEAAKAGTSSGMRNRIRTARTLFAELSDEQVEKFVDIIQAVSFK